MYSIDQDTLSAHNGLIEECVTVVRQRRNSGDSGAGCKMVNVPITVTGAQFRNCRKWPQIGYFLSVPHIIDKQTPVCVSVHGISRNAREHVEVFAETFREMGWLFIAPIFSESCFPRYQQLGFRRDRPGPRADLALNTVLGEVQEITGVETGSIFLFGFSGGGQFAQRYCLLHPQRVRSAVLGAPGWYTFPDAGAPFPRGLRVRKDYREYRPKLKQALAIPMAVVVGSQDLNRDSCLNTNLKIDLQQGMTRPERGMRWVADMRRAAVSAGYTTKYRYWELPGCGHSFNQCVVKGRLDSVAVDFFLNELTGRKDQ